MKHKIRVGPAGWSYKDWNGIVYPPKAGSKFDPLSYLAGFFDTIEINSTYYRPPAASASKSWAKRVAANRDFKFTAKLYQKFTHERGEATAEDEIAFREGIDPLVDAGRFGALLLQFPWSFKNTDDERDYLSSLLDRFKDYPLVVELRHASWNEPAVYQSFERRGVGFCNIDQPLFSRSIKPSARATSRVGYVRLHGRNYENWFRETAAPHDRYDYLYSPEELEPWVEKIKKVSRDAEETYVVTNNHFRGKGVVNALEIKAMLNEEKVPGPATLIKEYPRVGESIVTVGQTVPGPRIAGF
ncbi:MAG TPA: DUF72 domain-containing protein [Blastocatellia bacterium]|nr:DUF72 domain-containing protein [Blastocatellia bacterium]